MVAKNRGEGDLPRDERFGEFEKRGLDIWSCVAVDQVAGEHRDVGLLVVKDLAEEFESPGVGLAVCNLRWGYIATLANASRKMKVCPISPLFPTSNRRSITRNLDNLELVILWHHDLRFLDLHLLPSPHRQPRCLTNAH